MNQMSNIPPEFENWMSTENQSPAAASATVTSEDASPRKETTQQASEQPRPVLSRADATLLHRTLMAQEDGLARRSDLTELHKRIVKMMQTLGEGLSDGMAKKAAADRNHLTARIDTLEEAVNRMEGALRIEFEPVLRRAMAEVVAEQARPPRRLGRQFLWAGAVLAAGLVLGAMYHGGLLAAAQHVVSTAATILG